MTNAGCCEDLELRHRVVLAIARQDLADPIGRDTHRATARLAGHAFAPPTGEVVQERPARIHDLRLGRDPPPARAAATGLAVERRSDRHSDAALGVAVFVAGRLLGHLTAGVHLDPFVPIAFQAGMRRLAHTTSLARAGPARGAGRAWRRAPEARAELELTAARTWSRARCRCGSASWSRPAA